MVKTSLPQTGIDLSQLDLTLAGLRTHYAQGDFSPRELFAALLERAQADEHSVWIRLLSAAELQLYLEQLPDQPSKELPLYGIPFAIKDNIDLAGVPTTAACPDFSYVPQQSAFVVQQLIAAGAIPLGKTNMDQFATGLVGVRSPEPWGPCRNAFNEDYISGGSSSGSAVAVANGLVSFSLGTDTAGSGRVPASFNNIVGLKPSRGLLSCSGVVPACKSLDCVSIFALTVADANAVFDVAAQFDPQDPYARENSFENGSRYFKAVQSRLKLGVLPPQQREFFGDGEAAALYQRAVEQLQAFGEVVEIDFAPFAEAARLLYEGPWVAERYSAVKPIIENSPQSLLPVIREIIQAGAKPSAVDCFEATYRLRALRRRAEEELAKVDAIVTPTAPSCYRIEEVQADPIALNSRLGTYTNFMNLLDCAAVAVPRGFMASGVGFGLTLFQRAFADKQLLSIAAGLQQASELPLGASGKQSMHTLPSAAAPALHMDLVVCGAHLDGLPLNWQLRERAAQFVSRSTTSANYRLYALAGGPPQRPALVRDDDGAAIEVEVWRLPLAQVGSFLAEIPAPLGLGKVELADGRWLPGFICDHWGLQGSRDITEYGAWRRYIANS